MSLDQEAITQQLALLAAHRRTLAVYLRQQAELGVLAPPGIINGIAETQNVIRPIKDQLRADGVLVGGLLGGLGGGLASGLVFGLVLGLVGGLVAGLGGNEMNSRTTPNQGIHRSARSMLVVGLVSGLVSGLV